MNLFQGLQDARRSGMLGVVAASTRVDERHLLAVADGHAAIDQRLLVEEIERLKAYFSSKEVSEKL